MNDAQAMAMADRLTARAASEFADYPGCAVDIYAGVQDDSPAAFPTDDRRYHLRVRVNGLTLDEWRSAAVRVMVARLYPGWAAAPLSIGVVKLYSGRVQPNADVEARGEERCEAELWRCFERNLRDIRAQIEKSVGGDPERARESGYRRSMDELLASVPECDRWRSGGLFYSVTRLADEEA